MVALLVVCAVLLAGILRRLHRDPTEALAPRFDQVNATQERTERVLRDELARNREEFNNSTRHLREEVGGAIRLVGETVEKRLETVRGVIDLRLQHIQAENEKKLDAIRVTVDEKLQGTLEKRLGESFRLVSERLEAVHKGLGEMQNLAAGVGDLKKVLTNVKTRGTWGEVQLEALLEQMLAPGQWEKQVQVKRASAERVDFGVRMPGPDGDEGEPVWLPIDAKFPQEDYLRLIEAHERGDVTAENEAGKALEARVRAEARSIRDKYISPPKTTDFALLFLPTEGLYAEVLRRPGLVEALQNDMRVNVAGPTTLAALLNSLQLGFRTLAIQKRSADVWKLLSAVKAQYGKFGELLAKVDKKLQEASNTIGQATERTELIQKRLGKVEELPEQEVRLLLPDPDEEESGPD
ncbi:MAG: DNA recombination protein RmuC [Deltaproteobacteria bacterium]|nr:DNA recombination protein RmuC [Deltaproteobacteria bacterium]MBW2395937.1 DNA recombination protein RmuC [Deltaproteobacteria bacterium]